MTPSALQQYSSTSLLFFHAAGGATHTEKKKKIEEEKTRKIVRQRRKDANKEWENGKKCRTKLSQTADTAEDASSRSSLNSEFLLLLIDFMRILKLRE